MEEKKNGTLNVSAKLYLSSIAVIFALMVLTYVLTLLVPGGCYARTVNAAGNSVIDTAAGFTYTEGGLPFWKWLLSPVLVLGAEGNAMLIAVIVFLLVIGGIFNSLDKCGLMKYMLDKIVHRFAARRYTLLAVLTLFFMCMGAFIGSFEEVIPLVPIMTALAVGLGWDALTGMGMSLLAVGCGFSSGVMNPFTVGVAQSLSGLPMFSGLWLRLLAFALIYPLLLVFLRAHAKKVEKPVSAETAEFLPERDRDRALTVFGCALGVGLVLVLLSSVITVLQDYTMIIVAVMFLVGGTAACLTAKMGGRALGETFLQGAKLILPCILMILMASSIKYILTEAKILDTILYGAVGVAEKLPKALVILFVYLIVLGMNFFISSGSAKAFLLVPLIVPIAQIFGISAQLCVVAYAFGDGFSNVFYPTNAGLLISLGLAEVDYGSWAKWTVKFQALNLVLTSAILLLGLAVGY